MRQIIILSLIAVLAFCAGAAAENEPPQPPLILSIIPGQGAPGTRVTVSGAGFTEETLLFLGIEEIPIKLLSTRQLSFEIPQIASGNYALYLRQQGGESGRAYSFAIIPVIPQVSSISPDTMPFCASGDDRQITVRGKNFLEGAQILFDGALIRGVRVSGEEMVFLAPQIPGGLHQVQVKNPEETVSGPIALVVSNRPEVHSVSQGADYVNYYELNIEGENFQQGSILMVDGKKIQIGYNLPGERDRLIFNSCTSMTYQRYPYDPTAKSFGLIVVNPGGEESRRFTVTAP